MNKMKNPELEVVRFGAEDVIATSLYYTEAGPGVGVFFKSTYDNEENFWYLAEQESGFDGQPAAPTNVTPGHWYIYTSGEWQFVDYPYQYGGGPEGPTGGS